ncbi:phage tail tape measure protein [Oricola indica]|uniref:phage tail tape measure protein n=1 Tax=Oricola indica TaxID=2872591 RepID=UPI001CBC7AC7|nr:phage tail tape measure protein [Oricola indica]
MAAVATALIKFDGVAAGFHSAVAGMQKATRGLHNSLRGASASMARIGVAFSAPSIAAGLALRSIKDDIVDLDSAIAQIQKFSPLEGAALKDFREELKATGLELGRTEAQMLNAGAAALRYGVAQSELAGFLDLATRSSVAWGIAEDETSTTLARVQNNLTLSSEGLREYADSVNFLADTHATSAAAVNDAGLRMSAFTSVAGVSTDAMLAFATAGTAAGHDASRVETAWRKVLTTMTAGTAATTRQKNALAALGLSASDIASSFSLDQDGTVFDVLDRVGEIEDSAERLSILTEIFGLEGSTVVAGFVDRLDDVRASYNDLRNDIEAGSVGREAERQFNTASAALDRMHAAATAMRTAIGETLVPTFNAATAALTRMARFVDDNPAIANLAAQALLLGAAAGPAAFALSGLFSVLAFATRPLTMVTGLLGNVTDALLGSGKTARVAQASLARTFLFRVPMIAAAGAAVYALYQSWDKLREIVSDGRLQWAGNAFKTAFDSAMAGDWSKAWTAFRTGLEVLVDISRDIGAAAWAELQKAFAAVDGWAPNFAKYREALGGLADSLGRLFTAIFPSDGSIDDAGNALQRFAQKFVDGAFDSAATIVDTLASAIDGLAAAIERFNKTRIDQGTLKAMGQFAVENPLITGAGAYGLAAFGGSAAARVAGALKNIGPVKLVALALTVGTVVDAFVDLEGVNLGTIAAGLAGVVVAFRGLKPLLALLGAGGGLAAAGAAAKSASLAAGLRGVFAAIKGASFWRFTLISLGIERFIDAVSNFSLGAIEDLVSSIGRLGSAISAEATKLGLTKIAGKAPKAANDNLRGAETVLKSFSSRFEKLAKAIEPMTRLYSDLSEGEAREVAKAAKGAVRLSDGKATPVAGMRDMLEALFKPWNLAAFFKGIGVQMAGDWAAGKVARGIGVAIHGEEAVRDAEAAMADFQSKSLFGQGLEVLRGWADVLGIGKADQAAPKVGAGTPTDASESIFALRSAEQATREGSSVVAQKIDHQTAVLNAALQALPGAISSGVAGALPWKAINSNTPPTGAVRPRPVSSGGMADPAVAGGGGF